MLQYPPNNIKTSQTNPATQVRPSLTNLSRQLNIEGGREPRDPIPAKSGRGPGTARTVKSHFMKRTIAIDNYYDRIDVITSLKEEIGSCNILGVVKVNGEWRVTLKEESDIDKLVNSGVGINGNDVPVRAMGRRIATVSFFGVPYYVQNSELSNKLEDFGVKQLSK